MANTITISPAPLHAGQGYTICYHWENPNPGEVIQLVVTFAFDTTGSFSAEFVCPDYGDMVCHSYTLPTGAVAIQIVDQNGGAATVARGIGP